MAVCSGSLSGCPLKMEHGNLITDCHFWKSWPHSCDTNSSSSLYPLSLFSSHSPSMLFSLSLHPSNSLLLCLASVIVVDAVVNVYSPQLQSGHTSISTNRHGRVQLKLHTACFQPPPLYSSIHPSLCPVTPPFLSPHAPGKPGLNVNSVRIWFMTKSY